MPMRSAFFTSETSAGTTTTAASEKPAPRSASSALETAPQTRTGGRPHAYTTFAKIPKPAGQVFTNTLSSRQEELQEHVQIPPESGFYYYKLSSHHDLGAGDHDPETFLLLEEGTTARRRTATQMIMDSLGSLGGMAGGLGGMAGGMLGKMKGMAGGMMGKMTGGMCAAGGPAAILGHLGREQAGLSASDRFQTGFTVSCQNVMSPCHVTSDALSPNVIRFMSDAQSHRMHSVTVGSAQSMSQCVYSQDRNS